MNQLISNVLMQPKPDAVWRPTLIEKLEQLSDDRELTCQDLFEDGHFDDKKTELLIQQTGVMAGLQIAIDMVKQHSDWVPVSERLPDKDAVVLVYKQEFGLIGTAKYSGNGFWGFDMRTRDPMHKFTVMGGVTHWQPLPNPPSEVQE